MSGAICTWLSGTAVAGLMSLDDSKHRVAGVIVTGIMDAVLFWRSWSAKKHAVWNLRCQKVLSRYSCAVDIRLCIFDKEYYCLWIRKNSRSVGTSVVRQSFANLGSKRYFQRRNGARCGGSEYFRA